MGRKPRRKVRNPKLAIGYIRVSTDDKRQELGAKYQRDEITRWAARNDVEIVSWQTDEITGSAGLEHREGLQAALAEVDVLNAGLVVFQKWDRFGRASQLQTALAEKAFEDAGATLVSADGIGNGTDPEAQLMKGQVQLFAAYEKARIRARIKGVLGDKKARGELTGDAPYGMRVVLGPPRLRRDGVLRPVKLLEPDPTEQESLRVIRELRASGLVLREVSEEAARRGILNRKGKPFSLPSIHGFCKQAALLE